MLNSTAIIGVALEDSDKGKVIIVVPCQNEAGSIPGIVEDFLESSKQNEHLYLVEGGSKDNTRMVCQNLADRYKDQKVFFLEQKGRGKLGAIITAAHSDPSAILAIMDGDASIAFKDVQRAVELSKKTGTLVTGNRFGMSMEDGAMRSLNNLGNRVIAKISSYVYEQPIPDALCGTKVFPCNFLVSPMPELQASLNMDTYGDLSYFLAARLNGLGILSLDMHYKARTYGESGLNRFENGFELLRILKNSRRILKLKGN